MLVEVVVNIRGKGLRGFTVVLRGFTVVLRPLYPAARGFSNTGKDPIWRLAWRGRFRKVTRGDIW
jgi:hypothetical protein